MKRYLTLLICIIFVAACEESKLEPPYTTASISENFSSIENPLLRWRTYDLSDYALKEGRSCECFGPNSFTAYMSDGDVFDVEYQLPEEGYVGRTEDQIYTYTKDLAMSVEEAFSLIDEHESTAYRLVVEYDERFGYPSYISIDIDSMIVDEEIVRTFSDLERLVR
ncbi:MAG: DUF6174 domain-containing protein [Candidatus Marinimicrobia bacterium]|nr:DUF6174 domain-containing protein [Candidatus Neomarinimicrobiota bacterium]MCF7850311.1 DUF6174 domain-containing protein [Candidatus Neomarinimicrobiota bacterium]MCF7903903.1 DUF6174 domain-containing protein [Candidatus Neomarinimicrobiota bacterium]